MEVKSKKRGRPSKQDTGLEKDKIVLMARKLTLEDSKIPSIRRLASELNADPMAIYYYFTNKQKLLEAVSISLIIDLYIPDQGLNWKKNLMNLCKSYLSLLLNYPDLIGIILSGPNEGAASVFMERFERSVVELNLSQKRLKDVSDLLIDYLHGFAYAAACNTTGIKITDTLADGPLFFIIDHMDSDRMQ